MSSDHNGSSFIMSSKKIKNYRKGAIGAMMDEYERAAFELKTVVESAGKNEYERIADAETEDESCRSIQTIMSHVVGAGYAYANYIRGYFSMESEPLENKQTAYENIGSEIEKMLDYTARTLEGRWEMTDEEITNAVIKTRWGVTYDIEQLLEHAIVHILRHRRQIEKFLLKFQNSEVKL